MSVTGSHSVKMGWQNIKKTLSMISNRYSLEKTIEILTNNNLYTKYYGKSKNRSMINADPVLYLSIYDHTRILEEVLKSQKSWKGLYNFKYRIKFLVEYKCDINKLKCECGKRYIWTKYCRKCPSYHVTWTGRTHSSETKKKQRISALNYLRSINGQLMPRYNKNSIRLIEEYGKQNGYTFLHAENGGEYYIKELGYFLDAYDIKNNIVLEIDEKHHFDVFGNLKENDKIRQLEIENLLKCKFIRIKV